MDTQTTTSARPRRATKNPKLPSIHVRLDDAWPPSFTTAKSIGLCDELEPNLAALKSRSSGEASTLLATWMRQDPMAMVLLQFALTDETWAVARELVDPIRNLKAAVLPFGVGMLGLSIVPRLEEALAAKISKHAKFQYRMAIVAALAVEASRGTAWPERYDRHLAFDPSWWFPQTPYLLGNWHLDLQLQDYLLPLIRAALGGLPEKRARAILDPALDVLEPRKFPMAFFALPCLPVAWRDSDLPRAYEALRKAEDAKTGHVDSEVRRKFFEEMCERGKVHELIIALYKTGHMRKMYVDLTRVDDLDLRDGLLRAAKRALPPAQYQRLVTDLTKWD
jgi:hypothetical protein